MSHEERNAVVSILINIGVDIWVIITLYGLWQAGAFAGPDALQIWARTILWAVAMTIVATIALTILVAIVHGILTRDEDVSTDERDKAYQLRGMAVTMVVASFGTVGAIVALAFGVSGVFAMTTIYFAMSVGALTGDAVRLLSYRVWC